jgi:hypothetical protein
VSMVSFPGGTLSTHVNTPNFSILPLSSIIDSFYSSASGDVRASCTVIYASPIALFS